VLGTLGLGRVGRLALPTNLPSLAKASERVITFAIAIEKLLPEVGTLRRAVKLVT
jgi:hypothetical protein